MVKKYEVELRTLKNMRRSSRARKENFSQKENVNCGWQFATLMHKYYYRYCRVYIIRISATFVIRNCRIYNSPLPRLYFSERNKSSARLSIFRPEAAFLLQTGGVRCTHTPFPQRGPATSPTYQPPTSLLVVFFVHSFLSISFKALYSAPYTLSCLYLATINQFLDFETFSKRLR